MAAEYSYIPLQTVAEDENVLFMEGDRSCRKGLIRHRNGSGVFKLKGASNTCKTIYRVQLNANIAIAVGEAIPAGGISIALTQNGEVLGNTIRTVTPVAVGDLWSVSFETFVEVPCGCCDTIAVRNVSEATNIDVVNANIIFDRVA